MADILPRLRIMAVMGMFSSRAAHTWRTRGDEGGGGRSVKRVRQGRRKIVFTQKIA